MNKLLRPVLRQINVCPLKETKRFAGHSKWKNIKHTKEKNDLENNLMIGRYLRQMKAAIAEKGSAYPDKNMKLSYWVDEAKKNHVPHGTINAFLEKMQSTKITSHNLWINAQGPDGCLLVFHMVTDNIVSTQQSMNGRLKKHMCKLADGSVKSAFNVEGALLTGKTCDIDAATDIAIEIGAEEVTEIEKDGKMYLKFTCNPVHLMVVKRNLEKTGHAVISAEEEYTPISLVEVSDEGLEKVSKLIDVVKATGELVQVYDNIA